MRDMIPIRSRGGKSTWYCWWFRNPANHLGYINPVNDGINYIPIGAGFLPSTVVIVMV